MVSNHKILNESIITISVVVFGDLIASGSIVPVGFFNQASVSLSPASEANEALDKPTLTRLSRSSVALPQMTKLKRNA
jgi:hypothetical protein